jgi:citrate synthase
MSDDFKPGLEGIPAAKSAIGFIDGQQGILRYRGIRIEDLAENSTFEEVTALLLNGSLPTKAELDAFSAELKELRSVPDGILDILRALPSDGHPMVALQAATAALGTYFPQMDVTDGAGNIKASRRLIAALPTIVAAFHRIRSGQDVVAPDGSLSHAENFLYMLNGDKADEKVSRLMDVCLVLHAEHGFNASTFTGRVVGSTLANPYSVIAGAIGSLSGPLHGGANERVLGQLATIGGVEKVPAWFDDMSARREKIMGLGHRVYKVKDPRATVLQAMAADLFASHGSTETYDLAHKLETHAAEKIGHKGIYPNVDFYSGLVYEKMGIKTDLFTPVFAISRVSGWVAHWLEQLDGNRIYRPRQVYVGSTDTAYTPIAER